MTENTDNIVTVAVGAQNDLGIDLVESSREGKYHGAEYVLVFGRDEIRKEVRIKCYPMLIGTVFNFGEVLARVTNFQLFESGGPIGQLKLKVITEIEGDRDKIVGVFQS